MNEYDALNAEIVACTRCPRLRDWCMKVAREKRRSFSEDVYWGLPVPNFGDPNARGLIVGLAPAAHGANRTGRLFTGDRSGDWLFASMHRVGLANQPHATSIDDGLTLHGVMITPVNHCAPPDNKPTPQEIANCREWLVRTLAMSEFRAILCLGGIAWTQVHRLLGTRPMPKFGHGALVQSGKVEVLASYHPSQQNTFTGKLTEEMTDAVMIAFREAMNQP